MDSIPHPLGSGSFMPQPPLAHNDLSSQPSDTFPKDRRPRLMKENMGYGQQPYGPVSGSSPGLGLSGFGNIPGRSSTYRHPMDQFLRGDDQPYIPGYTCPPAARSMEVSSSMYRDTSVPSDCGTGTGPAILPSDSGYESVAKRSVANLSFVGEHDQIPDSLSHNLRNFQITTGSLHGHMQYQEELWSQPPATVHAESVHADSAATAPQSASTLVCQVCNISIKTPSEMKKHEARHNKPHRCEEPKCGRGFATQNDLDRHRRTVHRGGGIRYRCPYGKCQNKAKPWPRADNFKQHLYRVHSRSFSGANVDLESYRWTDWAPENDLTSVGVAPEQTATFDPANIGNDADDGIFQDDSTGDGNSFGIDIEQSPPLNEGTEFDELATTDANQVQAFDNSAEPVPQCAATDPANLSIGSIKDDQGPYQLSPLPSRFGHELVPREVSRATNDLLLGGDDSHAITSSRGSIDREEKAPPDGENLALGPARGPDPSNEEAAMAFLKSLEDEGLLQKLMERRGYLKANEPPPDTRQAAVPLSSSSGNNAICTKCPKVFRRKCELRKHMKRHEKPYGCTFANCKGSFGSKNDWKRHENSQHFQLDIWHCDVKGEGNPVNPECEKHYHRRESFQHHLKKCHGVQDEKVLEEKLNTCRMDRSRQTKFWCGFCRVMVDNKQHGLSGWNERYNHIESHLQGRDGFDKMTMLDWVPSEGPVDGDKQSDSSETTPGDDGAALDTTPDADIDAVTPHDTVSAPRKRPTEGGSPAPKRPRKRGSIQTMWICCNCHYYMMSNTSLACFNCVENHSRCSNCVVEEC